jgi:hypothetical protein
MVRNSSQVIHTQVTSILMKIKYINYRVATQNSLRCVVAAARSSCIWVEEGVSEVVSYPTVIMLD